LREQKKEEQKRRKRGNVAGRREREGAILVGEKRIFRLGIVEPRMGPDQRALAPISPPLPCSPSSSSRSTIPPVHLVDPLGEVEEGHDLGGDFSRKCPRTK